MANMVSTIHPNFLPQNHPPLITPNRPSAKQPGDWIHNEFDFEPFIKTNLSLKLDNDEQLCPDFVSSSKCPRGSQCPRRHAHPSRLNFLPPGSTLLRDPNKRTVCKHWLRGLCKKGDQCDYLHEYDLRRIPECRFYATFGFCNSGDDCLYLHVDKAVKRRECENYRRGFCPKGPNCSKKHVRRVPCPFYLCGFCPQGPSCTMGHIKSMPPSAHSRSSSPVQTHRPLTAAEAFASSGPRGMDPDQSMDGGPAARAQRGRYGVPSAATATGGAEGGFVPPPRQSGPPGDRPQGQRGWRKDLSEVLCFKCGEMGHFANMCPNPNRPGNRGGFDRGPGGRDRPSRGRPY